MTKEEVLNAMIEILKEIFRTKMGEMGLKEINDSDNLVELLGINSIMAIQVIVKIEKKFGIEFEDEKLTPEIMKEFSGLVNYVGKLIEEQN